MAIKDDYIKVRVSKEQKNLFKKVAELVIQGVEDRLTVSSILIKNGYTVGPDKRKRTPTGKTLDYLLNVYEEDSGAKEG